MTKVSTIPTQNLEIKSALGGLVLFRDRVPEIIDLFDNILVSNDLWYYIWGPFQDYFQIFPAKIKTLPDFYQYFEKNISENFLTMFIKDVKSSILLFHTCIQMCLCKFQQFIALIEILSRLKFSEIYFRKYMTSNLRKKILLFCRCRFLDKFYAAKAC